MSPNFLPRPSSTSSCCATTATQPSPAAPSARPPQWTPPRPSSGATRLRRRLGNWRQSWRRGARRRRPLARPCARYPTSEQHRVYIGQACRYLTSGQGMHDAPAPFTLARQVIHAAPPQSRGTAGCLCGLPRHMNVPAIDDLYTRVPQDPKRTYALPDALAVHIRPPTPDFCCCHPLPLACTQLRSQVTSWLPAKCKCHSRGQGTRGGIYTSGLG